VIASDDAMRTGSPGVGGDTETHEAIVVGAGSAGLSAASAAIARAEPSRKGDEHDVRACPLVR
jgi:hypothetical protein